MKIFDHKKEVVAVRAVNRLLVGAAGAAVVIAVAVNRHTSARLIAYTVATMLAGILLYRVLSGKTVTTMRLKKLHEIEASNARNRTDLAEFLANQQGKDSK